ncbi:MAG: M24 family metallopeptidase, partial [Clostridium sp.]|nr:M24 family metallopeptidase [Clostridium sp.]
YGMDGQAKDGDFILNDVGARYDYEGTDVSRGWPCNGKFSERQKILYTCAYNTSEYLFSIIKPGMPMYRVDQIAKEYCFEEEILTQRLGQLSGGEQNLLQLAKIAKSNANLLLLDEPTSHLDTYAQIALEEALAEYKGAVLMVAHDFYHIVNVADWVVLVEDKTLRKMRIRSFRKMIYEKHFSKDYLELEQKKKELETRVASCLKEKDIEKAKELCEKLEEIIEQMKKLVM